MVRREGGMERFDTVVDEKGKVLECKNVFSSIFSEEKADAGSVK